MSPASAFRTVQQRLAARETQDGYALMIALGVIAMTFLTLIALLGLAFTTSKVTAAQRDASVSNRAADAALEAALANVAARADRPCGAIPSSGLVVAGAAATAPTGRAESTVECASGSAADLSLPTTGEFGDPSVFVVDQTQGALRSEGGPPVRFDADVRVRGGATGPASGSGPAFAVAGQYRQGLAGVGLTDQQSTNCGPLVTQGGPQRVVDRNDAPECGFDAGGAALRTAALPRLQGNVTFPSTSVTVSTSCPPSGTPVTFSPGFYDRVAVRNLNTLIRTCGARTYRFPPGATPDGSRYIFDANDPDAGDNRHALVVDNPQATLIFGSEAGASATGAPAPRCSRSVSGSTIVLSGRTALRHRSGTLAVCPANGLPAILQATNAPGLPVVEMVSSGFGTSAAAILSPDVPAERTFPSTCNALEMWFTGQTAGGCRRGSFGFRIANLPTETISSLSILVNSTETPKTQNQDRNVEVDVSGLGQCRVTGSSGSALTALGRTPGLTTEIDLTACIPSLVGQPASVLANRTVTATVRYGYTTGIVPGDPIRLGLWGLRAEINGVRSTAGSAESTSWSNLDGAKAYDGQIATFNAESGPAIPVSEWRNFGGWTTPGAQRSITIRNLGLGAPVAAGDLLSTLDLVVASEATVPATDPSAATRSAVSDAGDGSKLAVELSRGGTVLCQFNLAGYGKSSRPFRIDLRKRACPQAAPTAGDVTGIDVKLTYTATCALFPPTYPSGYTDPATGRCLTVRVPDLSYVGLVATSDVVRTSPAFSEFTVNSTGTTSAGGTRAEAHIFGDVLMANSEVRFNWKGSVPGAGGTLDAPLVVGNLQVGRIVSSSVQGASVGVVCCFLPNPTQARLQAVIGGAPWAEAIVEVDSVSGTATLPRQVKILDWKFCASGTCGRRPSAP